MKILQESQIARYVMTGGATTAINYIIYIMLQTISVDYLAANCIAWLGAVIFAFFANRQIVFHSDDSKLQEFFQFFSLRMTTLVVETILLYLMVDFAGFGNMISKVLVSVITVVLNYVACKYRIFKEGGASRE